MSGWNLTDGWAQRKSADESPDADRRAAALTIANAHLRGVPAVPDRAAVAELLDMLGLTEATP